MSSSDIRHLKGTRASHAWLCAHGFAEVSRSGEEPRASVAWKHVQEHWPDVKYGFDSNGTFRKQGYPHVGGKHPTLAHLVAHATGRHRMRMDRYPPHIEHRARPLVVAHTLGDEFAGFLHANEHRFHLPPQRLMPIVAQWVTSLAGGAPSTLVSFVCPDWAVKDSRYTFDSVGDDVGLVAQRTLARLPLVWQFFRDHGHELNVMVAIGDFEGLSPETLARAGVSWEEFQERCKGSQEKLRTKLIAAGIPEDRLQTPLVTELLGDQAWHDDVAAARQKTDGDKLLGALGIDRSDFKQMMKARLPLYQRWYGKDHPEGFFDTVLRAQLTEYGVMGALALVQPNPLLLQCDAPVMGYGFQIFGAVSALYGRDAAY